jgi:transketolase
LQKQVKKPHAIIAHTLKGGGIASLAGKRDWHNRKPDKNEMALILSDLGMRPEDLKIEKCV